MIIRIDLVFVWNIFGKTYLFIYLIYALKISEFNNCLTNQIGTLILMGFPAYGREDSFDVIVENVDQQENEADELLDSGLMDQAVEMVS